MRPHAALAVMAMMTAVAGCYTGPGVEQFKPARSPHGMVISAATSRGAVAGELLELRDDGLVILRQQPGAVTRVTLVPWRSVKSISSREGRLTNSPIASTESGRRQLRSLSRYPAGAPDGVLAMVMESLGQQEIFIVGNEP
jgi:hypothetical protein